MKLINIINIILISLVCQSFPLISVVMMFVLNNVRIFKWIQIFALKIFSLWLQWKTTEDLVSIPQCTQLRLVYFLPFFPVNNSVSAAASCADKPTSHSQSNGLQWALLKGERTKIPHPGMSGLVGDKRQKPAALMRAPQRAIWKQT